MIRVSIALPALALSLLLFQVNVHATECWRVASWSTAMQVTPPSTGAYEQAVLAYANCDVTPVGYIWMDVTKSYNTPDNDLFLLVDYASFIADGFEMDDGPVYYQHNSSGIPMVYKDVLAMSSTLINFSVRSPVDRAPRNSAKVFLHKHSNDYCATAGPISDELSIFGLCTNSQNVTVLNELNGVYQLRSNHHGLCFYVDTSSQYIRHGQCWLDPARYFEFVPAAGEGYLIKSVHTQTCIGEMPGDATLPKPMVPCDVNDIDQIYNVVYTAHLPYSAGGHPIGVDVSLDEDDPVHEP